MCCTLESASLSDTILYAGTAAISEFPVRTVWDQYPVREVHVMGYQNQAETYGGPNAMVLPIPAAAPLTSANMLDMREAPDILKVYAETLRATWDSVRSLKGFYGAAAAAGGGYEVFDKGSYTVILAEHCVHIPEALKQVPEHKRPKASFAFLSAYARLYPKWPVAVCCWDGRIKPEPLFWWYEPKYPNELFMPTLDAHDGQPPKLDERVHLDHTLMVGAAPDDRRAVHVPYKMPRDLVPFIAPSVTGAGYSSRYRNGDFWVDRKTGRFDRGLRKPDGELEVFRD